MEIVYTVLSVIFAAFIIMGIFVLGAMFARMMILEAQADAKQDKLREEYYRLAGVKTLSDPRPYVPPRAIVNPRPRAPRSRMILPGMGTLDRLMKEGKRGTIMWRAGDRQK